MADGFTAAASADAVAAAVGNVTHVQLHTGDPGSDGTSNPATGVDRVAVSWAAGTAPAYVASPTWTIPAGGGGPYTHWSGWDAASGGTFAGKGTLNDSTTFGTTGLLATTITVTDEDVLS